MGLREEKKAETRLRISNKATDLFFENGYDNVTIEEIAQVAEVSKMTVFNYFARKEDMFFDRGDEIIQSLRDAVALRKKGESPVAALQRSMREFQEHVHWSKYVHMGRERFWPTVAASPALTARARELADEAADALASAFAASVGAKQADGIARLLAGMMVVACRAAYAASSSASSKKGELAAFQEMLDRGFAAMKTAAKDTPYG